MKNPYGIGDKPTIRQRFSERLSRFRERAQREAPAVAKRGIKRAGKGLAKAGMNFARNASFNINSGQQKRHWDALDDALTGGRGSQTDDLNDAILGIHSQRRNPNFRPPKAQNINIHIHSGAAPRKSKKRRGAKYDPFSI